MHLIAPPENEYRVVEGRRQASYNEDPDRLPPGSSLDERQREYIRTSAQNLTAGMRWDDTAEGYAFWRTVYERLIALSQGEALS